MTSRPGTAGLVVGVLLVAALLATRPGGNGVPDAGSQAPPAPIPAATQPPGSGPAQDLEPTPNRPAARGSKAGSPARRLIAATRRSAKRWADAAAARAAGYRSIGDAVTGHEHFVHPAWAADTRVLQPPRPESLVYRVDDGRRQLVSVMYVLPPGSTMDDVPDLGDERAQWHHHDDLCWDDTGRIAGLYRRGRCVPGGTRVVTPPMLHVWLIDHPCGPFAGLGAHGGACHHERGAGR